MRKMELMRTPSFTSRVKDCNVAGILFAGIALVDILFLMMDMRDAYRGIHKCSQLKGKQHDYPRPQTQIHEPFSNISLYRFVHHPHKYTNKSEDGLFMPYLIKVTSHTSGKEVPSRKETSATQVYTPGLAGDSLKVPSQIPAWLPGS